MNKPTGKLKFAYETIVNMEEKIDKLKAELSKGKENAIRDFVADYNLSRNKDLDHGNAPQDIGLFLITYCKEIK
tara:strand:+ start:21 stop:242 length:222 start_codon:yes stop_codon:yes gene_type:complete